MDSEIEVVVLIADELFVEEADFVDDPAMVCTEGEGIDPPFEIGESESCVADADGRVQADGDGFCEV